MPELPEVEVIKIFLSDNIIGLEIKSVDILNTKSFIGDSDILINQKVESVTRRAKNLQIVFGDKSLLIHLKMSGQLIFKGGENFIGGHPTKDMFGDLPNKSTRVIFNFSNGSKLFFNDQRKFGWVKLINSDQSEEIFKRLGPEPLEKEFTPKILQQRLQKRRNSAVKVVLLDQEIISGIGNIYACETCFLAKIDPRKRIKDLTDEDFTKLNKGIIESLKNGIKYGGSSKTHFADPSGKKGLFLDYAYVYGRENLPCKNCNTPVKKIKLGGRGTYYCELCQVD